MFFVMFRLGSLNKAMIACPTVLWSNFLVECPRCMADAGFLDVCEDHHVLKFTSGDNLGKKNKNNTNKTRQNII